MIDDIHLAKSVKQQNLRNLITRRNVVGVGVGFKETGDGLTDKLAVVVNVAQKLPKAQLAESDKVPKAINGVKTDVVETGRFLAGQTPAGALPTKARWPGPGPIPPGVSLSHADVTAGTFGCLVRRGQDIFILSNNHVLANVNSAKPGDAIIQPGRYDGGKPQDKVAELAEFIPLDFGGDSARSGLFITIENLLNRLAGLFGSEHRVMAYRTSPGENRLDAALARPLDPARFSAEILSIGLPVGVAEATLGSAVQKTGRTTGFTRGRITQIDVTTAVDYNGRAATFTDQLMASGMSDGGDSGSAVLDEQRRVVGLLFAGSPRATLLTPIQTVLKTLKVEMVTQ